MTVPMKEINIAIYGFGIAGKDVLRAIKRNKKLGLRTVGFFDDDPRKLGESYKDVSVLGDKNTLQDIVAKKNIEEIIIAMPSVDGEIISEVIRLCTEAEVKFKIVPRVREIIEGKVHFTRIRNVRVEDILGRPVIKTDVKELKNFFNNITAFVTGAAGSIGSELSRQISAYKPKQLILFDLWENGIFELRNELSKLSPDCQIHYIIGNIQDKKKLYEVFLKYKPDYVFHAAAYKHVPLMEENIDEAVKNNVFGTLNVATTAKKIGVKKFIFISTDKAADPKSSMGMTKFIGECLIKGMRGKTDFITVRFGNVLDSYGSVIPTFKKQIREGGPVTITDKRMTRYFMTIPEAAHLILMSSKIGKTNDTLLLDMGAPIKIVDLAKNLIRLSGFRVNKDIKIVYTGVRKGEKLHEILYVKNQTLLPSKKEKIFKVDGKQQSLNISSVHIKQLKKFSDYGQNEKIKEEFMKLLRKLK